MAAMNLYDQVLTGWENYVYNFICVVHKCTLYSLLLLFFKFSCILLVKPDFIVVFFFPFPREVLLNAILFCHIRKAHVHITQTYLQSTCISVMPEAKISISYLSHILTLGPFERMLSTFTVI